LADTYYGIPFRCASFDGDADRLVYFRITSPSSTRIDLVDGDKILSLFVLFIREQLDIVNANDSQDNKVLPTRFGVVQTAYANGASTEFLQNLGLEVVFTSTGVKYLHKKALEYDIGIYFEANGHGTVLFTDEFVSRLESLASKLSSKSTSKMFLYSAMFFFQF
jgi:phosphoacetylglucosamine mutase